MNVWIMNLLDNRSEENKPTDLQQSKFQFCKERGIVGIGWVGCDPINSKDVGFLRAANAFSDFKKDDLVWTKDPVSKEYYICRVTDEPIAANDAELHRYDISKFCSCEFITVGSEENLPQGILNMDLTSRTTISKANSSVSEITQNYIASLTSPTPAAVQTKVPPFSQPTEILPKKSKKPNRKKVITIAAISIIILALIISSVPIYKGISKSIYPLLPNGLKFGESFEAASKKIQNANEPKENKARKEKIVSVKQSEMAITNTEAFYPHLSIPLREKNPGDITYSFNTDQNDALYEVELSLHTPAHENPPINDFLNYYKTALKAYGDVSLEPVTIGDFNEAYKLTCKVYTVLLAVYDDETYYQTLPEIPEGFDEKAKEEYIKNYNEFGEKYGPPIIGIKITNNIYAPNVRRIISNETVMNAINNVKYRVGNDYATFSVGLGELLNRCAPGYQLTSTTPYLYADSSLISTTKRDELENGEYADYLSSSFIVQITGDLLQNPKVPYLVYENVNIIKLLLVFDESDNLIATEVLEEHQGLRTCALIYATG